VLQLRVGVRRTAPNNAWTRPFIADNQIDDAPIGKARNSEARDTIGNDVEVECRGQRRREIAQQLLARSGLTKAVAVWPLSRAKRTSVNCRRTAVYDDTVKVGGRPKACRPWHHACQR